MVYLAHLHACNRFDRTGYWPLRLGGQRVGFIRRDRVPFFAQEPDAFVVGDRAVDLVDGDADTITAALRAAGQRLAKHRVIGGSRGEMFAVTEGWGGRRLFELDRGMVPYFGTRSYGVHLNGWVRRDGQDYLWVGKRANDKKVAPGKLDNLVGGGISAGYDAITTLAKEAYEEAGMTADLVATARAAGAILYRMDLNGGLRDDVLFVYDIALPPDWIPNNTDGEFSEFMLMPVDEVLRLVRETDRFKFNVNLVLIDFALRHGFITPESPDYLNLVTGLRGGLIREAEPGP